MRYTLIVTEVENSAVSGLYNLLHSKTIADIGNPSKPGYDAVAEVLAAKT